MLNKLQLMKKVILNWQSILKEKYNFEAVAITLRESHSASRNGWSALLLDDKSCSESIPIKEI